MLIARASLKTHGSRSTLQEYTTRYQFFFSLKFFFFAGIFSLNLGFINSCFSLNSGFMYFFYLFLLQTIAEAVGDWYFGRKVAKDIDCAYPCDTTCHNLIPQPPTVMYVYVYDFCEFELLCFVNLNHLLTQSVIISGFDDIQRLLEQHRQYNKPFFFFSLWSFFFLLKKKEKKKHIEDCFTCLWNVNEEKAKEATKFDVFGKGKIHILFVAYCIVTIYNLHVSH